MTETIIFPHLGLTLSGIGDGIYIGSFRIAFYGITIACAMIAGIYMAMWVAKKTGQDPDTYFNFAILAVIISLLGARLYYVAFSWDYYGKHPLEILNFRGGGLAIYGGVIAGVLTAVVYSKVKHLDVPLMLDTACTGLVLGQAIGRWGNFFNREAFGDYTDSLFAMRLPLDAVRSSEVTEKMAEHAFSENGISWIQVHPTFLYESMWNLGVLAVMLIVTLKIGKRFKGEIFFLYLLGYGLGRVWIEGLRTDQLLIPGTGLAVSQLLSAVLVIAAALVLIVGFIRNRKN